MKGAGVRVCSVAGAPRVAKKQVTAAARIIAAVISDIEANASVSGIPIVSRAYATNLGANAIPTKVPTAIHATRKDINLDRS